MRAFSQARGRATATPGSVDRSRRERYRYTSPMGPTRHWNVKCCGAFSLVNPLARAIESRSHGVRTP